MSTYGDAVGYVGRVGVSSQHCVVSEVELVGICNKKCYVNNGIHSSRFDKDLNDASVGLEAGTNATDSQNTKEDEEGTQTICGHRY